MRDEQRCTERHADKHDRTVAHVSRPPATKVSKSSRRGCCARPAGDCRWAFGVSGVGWWALSG